MLNECYDIIGFKSIFEAFRRSWSAAIVVSRLLLSDVTAKTFSRIPTHLRHSRVELERMKSLSKCKIMQTIKRTITKLDGRVRTLLIRKNILCMITSYTGSGKTNDFYCTCCEHHGICKALFDHSVSRWGQQLVESSRSHSNAIFILKFVECIYLHTTIARI